MILLVDDEAEIREMTAEILIANGYKIKEASSRTEVMDILQKHPVEIVIMDIEMAGLNGINLGEEVKKQWGDLGLICLSSYADMLEIDLWNAGFDARINKPFSTLELLSVVEKVRDQRSGRDGQS